MLYRCALRRGSRLVSTHSRNLTLGVIGLGKMGAGIAKNLHEAGHSLQVYDVDDEITAKVATSLCAYKAHSPLDAAEGTDCVISILPNDAVLREVVEGDEGLAECNSLLMHVSISTVSPFTTRDLAKKYPKIDHISAPVFARPDGIAAKQAYFPMSGGSKSNRVKAEELLQATSTKVFDFGDDPGAANVVKLCGNYLIAASIQSMAEALALAEGSDLDRVEVMNMLNSTIFDCLIYRGYGQRVSERDHVPGGFALELGRKDVDLVLDTARKTGVPMNVGSVLHDRWLAAQSKGRGALDWSAVALSTSEDSGVDVSAVLESLQEHMKPPLHKK